MRQALPVFGLVLTPALLATLALTTGCGEGEEPGRPTVDASAPPKGDAGAPDGSTQACIQASDCASAPTCKTVECTGGQCVYANASVGTVCGGGAGCAALTCNRDGVCEAPPSTCSDPPDVAVPASCTPGTTFKAEIGGACGGTCNTTTGKCEYAKVDVACPDTGASVLPTTLAWQAKLREYLKSLSASDFTVSGAPQLAYASTSAFYNESARIQTGWWLAGRALSGTGYNFPCTGFPGTFEIQPSEFTLAQIEQSPPHAKVGWKGGVPTDYAAWLTRWNFPGNGYQNSKAMFLRAFAFSAADLMLTADRYVTKNGKDVWLWSALPYHGYVGKVASEGKYFEGTQAEKCGRAAYDIGMRRILGRAADIAKTWSNDPNGDMVAMGLRGFAYLAQALGDADAGAKGRQAAADLVKNNAAKNGYWNHFSGTRNYDASYEGTTFGAVREAAIQSNWPEVVANAKALLHTMAYLTLPEPGGQWYGPTHFSPATADPGAFALPASMESLPNIEFGDDAYFNIVADASGAKASWPALAKMQTDLHAWVDTKASKSDQTFDAPSNTWDATDHYSYGMPHFTFYKPEWYDAFQKVLATPNDPRLVPPFARAGNFMEPLNDDFMTAKVGDAGIVIHTGNVSVNTDGPNLSANGFGGGALSAFWTKTTGSALLGWSRGGQNAKNGTAMPNTWLGNAGWQGWKHWSTHALTGIVNGKPFSSARLVSVTKNYTVGATTTTVSASGDLRSATSDPQNGLAQALPYSRVFDIGNAAAPDGVRITTTAGPFPAGVSELYEILPIFDHAYNQRPQGSPTPDCPAEATAAISMVNVKFMQGATAVTPVANVTVSGVTEVRVERFGHSISITFDKARSVSLTEQMCTDYQQWGPVGRNLLIAVDHAQNTSGTIQYTIRPLP